MTLTPDAAGASATTAAGAHYLITPTAASGAGGFLAANYTITYNPYTGTVNPLSLLITVTGTTKVYGMALTQATTTSNFTSSGTVGSDVVTGITLTPNTSGATATTPAGASFTMVPSLPTGNSSFIAANYNITYAGFTGTVAAAPLTVNATGPLKAYGTALSAGASTSSFTALGAISGETVTSVTLTPDAAGLSSGTASGAPYTVVASAATGSGGFLTSNYLITYNPFAGTVGTTALTITATAAPRPYGQGITAAPSTNFIVSGTLPGQTVTSVTITPDAAGASNSTITGANFVLTPSAATGTGGFSAANYTINYVAYSGLVTPASLTITATGLLKKYGTVLATASTGAVNFSTAGTVNGDQVNAVTLTPDAAGAAGSTAVGSAYVETPSAPTSTGSFNPNNYTITFVPYHGTVTPGYMFISATGPAKIFGQALSATTGSTGFTAIGMAPGEQVNGVTLTPDAAGSSVTTAFNAAYVITPSAATGTGGFLPSNYIMTYNVYNGQVSAAPLLIVATGPAKTYGTALATVTTGANFVASGMVNSDQVTGVTLTPNSAGISARSAAGQTYNITPSLATGNSTFAASNYAITYIPFTGTVDPVSITVTATGPNKPFGSALTAGTSTINFSATAAANNEVVTGLTLSPDAAGLSANTPKGSPYQIIPSAATGTGGFIASNYAINYVPLTGIVGSTTLTITATGPGRIYGTALSATTGPANFTVTGLLNGDQVTGMTLTPDAVGATASSTAGSAYLVTPSAPTGNAGFVPSNYTVNYIPYSGTISPLALAIVATGPAKPYHTALVAGPSTVNFTATGLAAGDLVNRVTLTPDASGISATTAAGASYLVTPSAPTGNAAFSTGNYTITYTPYTARVTAPTLTVTATGPAKPYGTALSASSNATTFTATGAVGGETVTGVTLTPDAAGVSATTAFGATYVVTPSAASGANGFVTSNYVVNYVPFTGTVSAQALTVFATGPLKKYGVALAAGSSTSSFGSTGLAPGETITSVTLTPDAAGLSTTTANGGAYSVIPSAPAGAGGFNAANYTVTYVPYSGVVGSNNLTITATSPNKTYGLALTSGTATTGFTASGTLPGETVTGITLTANAPALAAATAAGTTYTITPTAATGTGGFLASNYTVTYVPYSGPVIPASLSILANGPVKAYGAALASGAVTTGFTTSGIKGADQVTGVTMTPDASGQSVTAAVGANYQVMPSAATGNGSFLTSNYAITYLPYAGIVGSRALTVTATGPYKPYGTPLATGNSTSNFTATGMAGGETVTGAMLSPDAAGLSASTPSGASYSVVPSAATGANGFLASNYVVNYVAYSGTVNPLVLTITATGTNKTYGQALATGTTTTNFMVSGAVGGDQVSSITLTPDAAGLSASTAAGASFRMTPSAPTGNSSFIAANYTINYVGFTGTVAQAPLAINATGPLKKYGFALSAGASTGSFTATGAITGETVGSVTLTPDAAGLSTATANGAPYAVAVSAATGSGSFNAANYAITYNPYSGTVGTSVLTITATGPAKLYGTAIASGASGQNFTASGTFAGETVTSVTLTPDAAGASSTTQPGASYSVTPTAATGTGGFMTSNYTVTYVPYTATVVQAPLTLTATGPAKGYGVALASTNSTTNFNGQGMVNGDVINSVTLTPDAAGASATTAKGSGYVIMPSLPLGSASFAPANYAITYVPYNGIVTSATVTVTATGLSKVFGTALISGATTNTALFTASGMASGESVTGVTLTPDATGLSASSAYNAGYLVTPSVATGTGGFLASNYTMVYLPFHGLVTRAAMTVTATGSPKTYGTALVSGLATTGFTATGAAGADQVTGVTLTPDGAGLAAKTAANAGYSIMPSLVTGNGSFNATNYQVTYVPFTGTVNPFALSVAATGPAKPFGTALAITTGTTNFTAAPAANGEAITGVTLSPDGPGQAANTPQGTAYQVIPSNATGTGGFVAPNYAINYIPYTGSVGGTTLTITVTGPGRVYGSPLSTTTGPANFTVSGLINGDQITGMTLTPDATGASSTAGAGSAFTVTPSAPTGNASFLASNYAVRYIPYSGVISPLNLTLAATGPAKLYHTALAAASSTTSFTATGLAAGDLVSSMTLTPDAAGASATTAAGAAYVITPSAPVGNSAFNLANYTVTYMPYTGTVGTSVLTVTATGPNKPYGKVLATAISGVNFTATGMVGGETVTGLTLTPDAAGASATTASGASYIVTPSAATGGNGFNASNYTVNYLPFTGTVSGQALTITATGPLKRYGMALGVSTSTSSFTVTGLAPGESITSVTLTPDAAGSATTTANGAAYAVLPSAAAGAGGFVAANYSITYLPYSGTVGSNNLVITATSPNKIFGQGLSSGTATIGFTPSGTFPGETVTGSTLTADAAGLASTTAAGATYTVTPAAATGTGGFLASNYTVTYVPYTGQVIAAPLTILATGPAKPYGTVLSQSTSATGFTASGAVGADVVSSVTLSPDASGQAAATATGATYQVIPSLPTGNGSFAATNYAITYLPYTGTVSAIPLTVTATGPTKLFGTALTSTSGSTHFTATGMAGSETVTGINLTPDAAGMSSTTPSGSQYVVTPTGATGTNGFLASNYTITYIPYTGTVNALALTISATGTTKVYGQALTAATVTTGFTATGTVGADAVTGIILSPDAAGQSATTTAGSAFVMTPSQPVGNSSFIAANYIISYVGFTGTVAPAALAINATGPLKKYGTALSAGTSTSSFTATGAITGETVTSVTLTPDAAGVSTTTANGAPYMVAATAATGTGGFNAANYAITYTNYNGTVGTANLTITATGPAKSYGTALSIIPNGTNFITSGTFPGETVTAVTLTPNGAGASANSAAGSSYSVVPTAATGTGGFLASNYVVTYVPYTAYVTPATLAVTASAQAKNYGQVLSPMSTSLYFSTQGLVNGDMVNGITLTPDIAGQSASTPKGAGYIITPSSPTGNTSFLPANYTISYNPYYGTVASATVTITATGPGKIFGQALSASTGAANFTASGMATGEVVTGLTLTPDAAGASATTAFNSGYVMTPSAATGTGGFIASNYTMVYNPYHGLVEAAPLTIIASGPSKIYGQVLAAATSATNFTATGLVGLDQVTSVTLTPNSAGQAANTQVNANYAVTPSLATGNSSFAASNYAISYIPFTGTVNPAMLNIAATGPLKQFGQALTVGASGSGFTATGVIAGEAATSVTLTPDGPGQAANTPRGASYIVTPSAATGTGGFNASNYLVNYQPYTGTVSGTILTITATGPGRIYGTALTAGTSATNYTVSGLLGNDQITSVTLTPDANGATAATASGASYTVTPSGATGNGSFLASNYIVSYVPYSGVISPLALTIAATGPGKTYRDTLAAGTSTSNFTATGLAAGDVVSAVTLTPDAAGQSATTAAGAAYIVTPSAPTGNSSFSAANYTINYLPYTGTVGASVLTVTATGPVKTYGTVLTTATSAINFTVTGLVGGENVTGVTLTPDAAGVSATTVSGGSYTVTPSAATGTGGFLAANYTVNYFPFTGVVSPQALLVNAVGPLKKYGMALAAGVSTSSFIATGLLPGETITSVTLTPDAAGQSTTTANGANYGVVASAATGAGGFNPANYTITYSTYTGTVGNLNLTITAASPNKQYGQALASGISGTGFIASGTLPGETVSSMTLAMDAAAASATTPTGNAYTVAPSLATGTGGFLASNYVVTYMPYTGAVTAAPLTILANGPAKAYGTQLAVASGATTFTASGAVAGDVISTVTLSPDASGQNAQAAALSTYQVMPSLATGNSSYLASNYAITYLPYTGTVSKGALTITATGPNKPFGTPLAAGTTGNNFTASGLVTGETVTGITLTPDASGMAANTPSGTNYVMTPSKATGAGGFLASNYTVSYVPYTGTVNPLSLVITATGTTKTYGQALTAAAVSSNYTVVGAVNGDLVSGITLTPDARGASATTAVGTSFVVSPSLPTGNSSFIAANYAITYIGFTGTVTGALLTINTTGPLRKYGTGLVAGSSASNFTATGLMAGETVTSVMLTPDAAGRSATTATGAPYAVSASAAIGTGGFLASNYTVVYHTYNGIVGTTALTITATNPAKTYGTALATGVSTTGFITTGTFAGEQVTSVTLTPDGAGASASTQTGSAFSVVPAAATGTGGFLASNYVVTYVPYSGIVIPAALTVTATGPAKPYGVALTTGASATNFGVTGLVNGDAVSSVTLTPNAAGLSPTTASGAGYVVTPSVPTGNAGFNASNYTVTYLPYYGTVIVTPLTITATGPNKVYGTALTAGMSAVNFTATGMLPGQTVTGLTLTPDANGLAASTPAGSGYTVQPSLPTGTGGFQASNYTVVYVGFSGTVAKRVLNITAKGTDRVYNTTRVATVVLADDRLANDQFTIAYTPAAFSDKHVGVAKAITVSGITLAGQAASNYTTAAAITATATITPAAAMLTAQPVTKVYNATVATIMLPVMTGLIGSDANGLVLSETYDTRNVGVGKTLTPVAQINDGNNGNDYTVAVVSSTMGAITTAPLTVTAVAATKGFDGTLMSATLPLISGLISPDAPGTYPVETYDTPEIGGGKTLTPSGLVINDGNSGNNYAVRYISSISGIIIAAPTGTAFLSNLTTSAGILTPLFKVGDIATTLEVSNSTASITVTPTITGNAAITVNGAVVGNGLPAVVALKFGKNLIPVKVIASDGTVVSTYTLTINRDALSNADLIALFPSSGILSPSFNTDILDYTTTVDYFVSSISIAASLSDPNASVTINGLTAPNNILQGITLNVGSNIITVVVTAQDRVTQKTYTVEVKRSAAPLAVLGDNVLTPNGDGVNDLWVVSGILAFPQNVVTVYDRTGRVVFTQKTYDNTWGGTYRGAVLPEDTYYYTIDLHNGTKVTRGFITLIHDHK